MPEVVTFPHQAIIVQIFLFSTGSMEVSVQVACDSVYPLICLSNLGASSLPCDLIFLSEKSC